MILLTRSLNMKVLLLALALTSTTSWAVNLDMNPGLWSVRTDINHKGQNISLNAEIEKAMKGLGPEQRAQMEAMMKGVARGSETQACYTKEMLEPKNFLNNQEDENCQTTSMKNTATSVDAVFKCKNGDSGSAVWTIKNKSSFTGLVKMTNKKGENSKITYTGKFVSTDCGELKPEK